MCEFGRYFLVCGNEDKMFYSKTTILNLTSVETFMKFTHTCFPPPTYTPEYLFTLKPHKYSGKYEKVCLNNQRVFISFVFDIFYFITPETISLL